MFTTTSLSLLALSLASAINARALTKRSITWDPCTELNANLSKALEVVGPYTAVECATLPVPLDYTNKDSPRLELDLFRVKATKEPVLGTVLFNPGGPGGTGAENLPPAVTDIRLIVGEQYNILSWDPRGTGNTIPFNASAAVTVGESTNTQLQKRDEVLPRANLTSVFLESGWALAGEAAEAVVPPNAENGSLIGTAFVARDMLEIVDALGEDGLLRYYGLSYGTVLGHYFATMFPDRVERMILDGNLDPNGYRNGTWGDSLADTDKTFEAFINTCFDAGDDCALVTYLHANSSQDLFDAVNAPIAAYTANLTDEASASSAIALKGAIFSGLYNPGTWPKLAETVVSLLNATGDATNATDDNETASNETAPWHYGQAVEPIFGIRASDATFKPTSTEEYLPTVEYQSNLSGFSDIWYFPTWVAARWKLPAKERFYGNFTAKTKNPILYVNGDHDPVTPLQDAIYASKGFEGSVVLAHGGFGHGMIADPSSCVHQYTRAYFMNGTLPAEGTYCEPDLGPWELYKARGGMIMGAIESPNGTVLGTVVPSAS